MTRDAKLAQLLQRAMEKVTVTERRLREAKADLKRIRDLAMTPDPKPDGDGERKAA